MLDKLTVILLNWKRPKNASALVTKYLAMPAVAQVILFDCNPSRYDTDPSTTLTCNLKDSKLLLLAANSDPGLVARFAAAALARTCDVLLVDDDIELPAATVEKLHLAYCTFDVGAVGLFGRHPEPDGVYPDGQTIYGPCPILLTRAVITSRKTCTLAADATHKMVQSLGGEPYGNGEDIVLSYQARCQRKQLNLNLALKLLYTDLDAKDANSISVRYAGHAAHRTNVVRWCRNHFGVEKD